MKKILIAFLIFGSLFSVNAQDLNNYKYVIVPKSFEFSKRTNQYQLNALTKFLFEKYGFKTLMEDENKPMDLARNNCLGLKADVNNNSGLFVTKMVVTLTDCQGNVVFTSKEGRSREKEFKTAWHEALRDAFTSVAELDHNYEADPAPEKIEVAEEAEEVKETHEAEVAAELPEKPEEEMEEMPEETEKVAEEEVAEESPKVSGEEKTFAKDGMQFRLEETSNGYSIYQKGMAEPFATLIKTDKANSYIYNSLTKQGIAYFDESGSLVVEYFDASQNKTIKAIYTIQN